MVVFLADCLVALSCFDGGNDVFFFGGAVGVFPFGVTGGEIPLTAGGVAFVVRVRLSFLVNFCFFGGGGGGVGFFPFGVVSTTGVTGGEVPLTDGGVAFVVVKVCCSFLAM